MTLRAASMAILLLAAASLAQAQGTLTPPPGAPAPTMKSLDQVHLAATRGMIEVNDVTTPGDATSAFVLSEPGSYYLSGNIENTDPAKAVIRITAPRVSLDLQGHTVLQNGGAIAIADGGGATGVVIRNGSVIGGTSVALGLTNGRNYVVEDLQVFPADAATAVSVAIDSVVRRVKVTGGTVGISGGAGVRIEDCHLSNCASVAIWLPTTDSAAVVRGNHIRGTETLTGILADRGAEILGNYIYGTKEEGIRTGPSCRVVNNTVTRFGGRGIEVNGGSALIAANYVSDGSNSGSANTIGCRVLSNGCTVRDNEFHSNAIGLQVNGTNNVIIRNTAGDNSLLDFDFSAGNREAVIITDPAAGFNNGNGFANISF